MEDIKESFETYINATPRGISDELTQKIIELDEILIGKYQLYQK